MKNVYERERQNTGNSQEASCASPGERDQGSGSKSNGEDGGGGDLGYFWKEGGRHWGTCGELLVSIWGEKKEKEVA